MDGGAQKILPTIQADKTRQDKTKPNKNFIVLLLAKSIMTKLHSSPSPPLIWFGWLAAWLVLLLTANTGWMLPPMAEARAILGVDLGSLYMKVALVQSGSPLEIVTNLHSKRKTEQMILFDREQRFYGADASSLLARKAHQTPAAMTVLLGRDDRHPIVEVSAMHCESTTTIVGSGREPYV